MSIDDRSNNTRLYLGAARYATLLEVASIVEPGHSEVVIHAMRMRSKYLRLLPGE